jgi:ParB-like chromosome segregation protein Spo0J
MQQGHEFQAIAAYQLGSRYFVIDGHTRVAAAKALKIEFIDADVTECLPRRDTEVNLTYYARREFERYTGLEGIRLTAAWRYHLLHHHIEGYRLYLERSRDREVSLREAARIWARAQYTPTLLEIRRRRMQSTTGGRTSGDVYVDILKAWSEEKSLAVSLREQLENYDQAQKQTRGVLQRTSRAVREVVDAALPKAIPPLSSPRGVRFADQDVEAELEALPPLEPPD